MKQLMDVIKKSYSKYSLKIFLICLKMSSKIKKGLDFIMRNIRYLKFICGLSFN